MAGTKAKRKTVHKPVTHKKFVVRMAHHEHSGKHLPFHYTSYAILFFLLIFVTAFVFMISKQVNAYEQIKSGSISLSGFSKGPPPKNAPVITSPVSKNVFEKNVIAVEGTCEPAKYIEIYRNTVMAGGAICSPEGTFKIYVTLVPGKNVIYARIHDALWQYGPDSKSIVVWYNVPAPKYPVMLVYTRPIQKGVLLGQDFPLEYTISGGKTPYAVSINWGDGSVADVHVHKSHGSFRVNHKYEKAGQYVLLINVKDDSGQTALIQSVVVVHSTEAEIPLIAYECVDSNNCTPPSQVLTLLDWVWPALLVATLMTASFWIGEKYVYKHQIPLKTRHA